jgi:hypothetical protein
MDEPRMQKDAGMLKRLFTGLSALKNFVKADQAIVWLIPTLCVPSIRFFQDPVTERKKLFVRDFSTYAIGAALFFMVARFSDEVLKKTIQDTTRRYLASIFAGTAASVVFCGIGAVRLSQWMGRKFQERDALKRGWGNTTTEIRSMPVSLKSLPASGIGPTRSVLNRANTFAVFSSI